MEDKDIFQKMFPDGMAITMKYDSRLVKPFYATVTERFMGCQDFRSVNGVTALETISTLLNELGQTLQARIEQQERLELAEAERLSELRRKYSVVK